MENELFLTVEGNQILMESNDDTPNMTINLLDIDEPVITGQYKGDSNIPTVIHASYQAIKEFVFNNVDDCYLGCIEFDNGIDLVCEALKIRLHQIIESKN